MRRLGVSTDFWFFLLGGFCFLHLAKLLSCMEDSSRTSIRTLEESRRTRCLLGSDRDESGLLSKGRPITAQPLHAVTQTRD